MSPTVPYQTPRVAPSPLPGIRVSTDTPSGAFGVGSAIDLSGPTKLLEAHRKEAEDIQFVAADNQLHELRAKVQQDAVQHFRGINALGAEAAARSAWETGVAAIQQSVPGDHLKAAVASRAVTHWGDLLSSLTGHADTEYRQAQTREFASAIDNKLTDVTAAVDNPARRDRAFSEGRATIVGYARLNGWSPEETRQHLDAFTSTGHSTVIERLVSAHDDLGAAAYLDAHRDELSVRDLASAEQLTGEASVLGEGQRAGDRITGSAATLTDGLAEAAKLTNPRVRAEAEHQVRQHFSDLAAADREAKAGAFTAAGAIVEKTGTFDAVPVRLRMQMSPEENGALQRRANQIRNPERITNPGLFNSLLNSFALPGARDWILSHDVGQYRNQLSDTDYKHVLGMWIQGNAERERGLTADLKRQAAADQRQREKHAALDANIQGIIDRAPAEKRASTAAAFVPNMSPEMAARYTGAARAPGGPITPAVAPVPVVRAVAGRTIPPAWLERARHDAAYRDYARRMGYITVDDAPPAARPVSTGNVDLRATP